VLTTGPQIGNAVGVSLTGVIFFKVLADSTGNRYANAFSCSLVLLLCIALAAGAAGAVPTPPGSWSVTSS